MKRLKSYIKNILFTGGGGIGNELIWKTLKKKYNVYFCDMNIDNVNIKIPKKNILKVPAVKNKKYIKSIKKICDKYNIDIIVPGIDEELKKFKKNENLFKRVFLPSIDLIKKCNDKWLFYQECKKNKINVPTTSLAKKFQIQKHKNSVILKPRFGRGSQGIIYCKNQKIAKAHLKILNMENKLNNYIIQDYVKGNEFTVTQYFDKKSYLYQLLVHVKKGVTIRASATNDINVNHFCKKISEVYEHEKIYNIQLIKTKKKCTLIEINPRISTTFCFFLANGFDPFQNRLILRRKLKFNFLNRQMSNILK